MNAKIIRSFFWAGIVIVNCCFLPHYALAGGQASSTLDNFTTPQDASSTLPLATVNLHIRYQDALVFEGTAAIPFSNTIAIPDDSGVSHQVSSASVLGMLYTLDQTDPTFRLSDLAYFDSFHSFLINCIDVTQGNIHACYNWQYVVNGVYPLIGVDQYVLHGGDDVYLYFGFQHRVQLSTNTTSLNVPFTATAQNYLYTTNNWGLLTGVTLGVIQTNPADQFSPIVKATSTVDSLGQATFSIAEPGQYNVGIVEDFYYPSTPLIVQDASTTPSQNNSSGGGSSSSSSSSSSGGGGGSSISHYSLDIPKAIQFLNDHKNRDGSFGTTSFINDWVAIALASYQGANNVDNGLKTYLQTNPDSGAAATDYERRAMALMALGINPYAGTSTNYIQKIVDKFDGQQVGDPTLVNDDVFAIFPLFKAGYSIDSPIMRAVAASILSAQQADGSWIGGVDMTAAAIQALSLFNGQPDMARALKKAQDYLVVHQNIDGSFNGNPYSTTWAMQAIVSLGQDTRAWQKGSQTPDDYLYEHQASDGGLASGEDLENRIWLTAYAIPSALKKPWLQVLGSYINQTSDANQLSFPSLPAVSLPVVPVEATSTIIEIQATSTSPIVTLHPLVAVNTSFASTVPFSSSPSKPNPSKSFIKTVNTFVSPLRFDASQLQEEFSSQTPSSRRPVTPSVSSHQLAFAGSNDWRSLLASRVFWIEAGVIGLAIYLLWKFLHR